MKSTRLVVLGVALAAAAGAGYIAMNMQPQQQIVTQEAAPAVPQLELEQVLIASEDIPVGGVIESQIAWQDWPKAAVTEGFITQTIKPQAVEELKGSVARVVILKGEPIRDSKLVGKDQSLMSSILPSGMRAIAVEITADTSAGGFILPNDYVDVIMTRRATTATGGESFVTETILSNIRVLAIDQTIREDEEGRKVKVGQTATLELTPSQSEIVTVAQQMADRLALALRSTADANEAATLGSEYLVNGRGKNGSVKLIKSGEITVIGSDTGASK
ncbi:MAG: Flp pilus assembly protein CpaB [Rhizobiaceae bacterium]